MSIWVASAKPLALPLPPASTQHEPLTVGVIPQVTQLGEFFRIVRGGIVVCDAADGFEGLKADVVKTLPLESPGGPAILVAVGSFGRSRIVDVLTTVQPQEEWQAAEAFDVKIAPIDAPASKAKIQIAYSRNPQ